jgi:hypothetical protein
MEKKVRVIIPNYNGLDFLTECIKSLKKQTCDCFDILVVDNGSDDGSRQWLKKNKIPSLFLTRNRGFAGGVNAGIRISNTKYIILLNNDTIVFEDFVENLLKRIETSDRIFAVNPMMIQAHRRELIDDAGDGYSIMGWAYQRGTGEKTDCYEKAEFIFSACAGASIYRTDLVKKFGLFDEMHFAYLEDIDLSYRARLAGCIIIYEPKAKVYHLGSATSGSKYNPFKVRLTARNNIYLNYKNQSDLQLFINALPLILGIVLKGVFFLKKGFLKDYIAGIIEGVCTFKKCRRVDFKKVPIYRIMAVEFELLLGALRYTVHFIKRRL